MNIDCMPLFPSNLFKSHIDPLSYDKTKIIETVLRNYDLQNHRNEWDNSAKMHHYYNDWENELFEKIDLSEVTDQYHMLYKNILDQMFNSPINFNVVVENITVHKGSDNFMTAHNHINEHVFLSGVHYIKCDEKSAKLSLINPLIYLEYPNLSVQNITSKKLDGSNPMNSSYFKQWEYSVNQDEMIVFPAYLNHKVERSEYEDSDFRIAIVTNLQIFNPENQ